MAEEKKQIVIDAENAILGRLASYVVKQAMLGKKIIIVNSERAIITGTKKDVVKKYQARVKKGGASQKGPKILRNPEKIIKRTIRGMIKHKKGRGQAVLSRIMCYNKIPKQFEEVKKIKAGKEKRCSFVTLKELVGALK